jgi:hypothetical protein
MLTYDKNNAKCHYELNFSKQKLARVSIDTDLFAAKNSKHA